MYNNEKEDAPSLKISAIRTKLKLHQWKNLGTPKEHPWDERLRATLGLAREQTRNTLEHPKIPKKHLWNRLGKSRVGTVDLINPWNTPEAPQEHPLEPP